LLVTGHFAQLSETPTHPDLVNLILILLIVLAVALIMLTFIVALSRFNLEFLKPFKAANIAEFRRQP
jgi:hypothetical protein